MGWKVAVGDAESDYHAAASLSGRDLSFGCNIFEGLIRRMGRCGSLWKVRDNL
jgi:hypothetical protein